MQPLPPRSPPPPTTHPATPRQRANRRQSFALLPTRNDSELSQRRRQNERLQQLTRAAAAAGTAANSWRWWLGIAAGIEFLAYTYSWSSADEEELNSDPEKGWWNFEFLRWKAMGDTASTDTVAAMETVVRSMASPIWTTLYLLYFVHGFFQAKTARHKTFQRNERARLLNDDKVHMSYRHFWNPSLVWMVSLVMYLALLPTWFWWQVVSTLHMVPLVTSSTIRESAIQHAEYSLGYAMLVHFYTLVSTVLNETLVEYGLALERYLKIRLARFAILHPRTFLRRYQKVQLAIIWIKYLAPIGSHIMNSNVVGVTVDLVKRWKQTCQERYQYVRRRTMWAKLDDEHQTELAAVIIQRNYRSYRSRKWVRIVRLQREQREEEIIHLVHSAIRRRAKEDLEAQERALKELEAIQERNKVLHSRVSKRQHNVNSWSWVEGAFDLRKSMVAGANARTSSNMKIVVSDRDLKRKYELQQEVRTKINVEKQRLMLLRPDSKFVVRYRLGYVVCAIMETAHLALQPRLEEDDDGDVREMDSRTMNALRLFLMHCHSFINAVLCLGVFIQFFVGEFDSMTGKLVRRSFFSRWIYPGILLHLLVNASVAEVSAIARSLLVFAFRAGPGKVYRWGTLFLFPIWRRLLSFIEWRIWIRLVRRENENLVVQPPARRRSSISNYY